MYLVKITTRNYECECLKKKIKCYIAHFINSSANNRKFFAIKIITNVSCENYNA